jgi:hypothetical protein
MAVGQGFIGQWIVREVSSVMRPTEVSIAVVFMLALDVSAYSASTPEQTEPVRQASLVQAEVFGFESGQEPVSFRFHLEEWLGASGSGGFPADFTDENRRKDPWEEPPQ